MNEGDDPPTARPPLHDQRFELLTVCGVGGAGRVWRAVDTDTGERVALKQIPVYSTAHLARVRREIAALRRLQIPGVVRLIDTGEVHGEPYIVMELLEGAPFPGPGVEGDWRLVVRRALAMCETLARVHTLRVVHRDLKPGNVNVDANGRVVLLDFGLARGEDLAETVTEDGGIVGTLRYLAPEQLRGQVADAKSDLYAVGVMLHEALSGRSDFDDGSAVRALLHGGARTRSWPRIDGVPDALDELVQRLLQAEPTRRPDSARTVAEALALVLGEALPPRVVVPFVGREALLARLGAAARRGAAIEVDTVPGMGASRLLEELAAHLRAVGTPVVTLRPAGDLALAAFTAVLGPVGADAGALSRAYDRLATALRAGTVLLCDDPSALDLWSRRLVERAAAEAAGCVIRIGRFPGAAERLAALGPDALRPLFAGPDAFLHLVEDGAHLLHHRTGGVPAQVVREIEGWIASGRARWTDTTPPRLEVARSALEELGGFPVALHGLGGSAELALAAPLAHVLAWIAVAGAISVDALTEVARVPAWELDLEVEELVASRLVRRRADGTIEAQVVPQFLEGYPEARLADMHRRLAKARPDDAEARMRHWLLAGETAAAVAAAADAASEAAGAARFGRAMGLYAGAVRAARGAADRELEVQAVGGYVGVALAEGSRASAEAAIRVVERCGDARVLPLADVARAVLGAARGEWLGAARHAQAAGTIAEDRVEAARVGVLVRCANLGRALPIEEALAVAEARAHTPDGRSQLLSLRGLVAYAAGDFDAAAALQREARAAAGTRFRRLIALSNLAVACLAADAAVEAAALGEELRVLGRELRLPVFERWGFMTTIVAAYRSGRDDVRAEAEEREASRMLAEDLVHASLCLALAAAAWRRGEAADARTLAEESVRAARAARRADAAAIAAALAVATGSPEADTAAIWDEATAPGVHPRVREQVRALLVGVSRAPPGCAAGPESTAGLRLERIEPGGRLDVLAPNELLSYPPRSPGSP